MPLFSCFVQSSQLVGSDALKPERSNRRASLFVAFIEILLIFGVFFAYGAWPTPDVNEQYYVGKAIHFWNPSWLANDPFLNTPDSHWFFYATFGLLSFLFSQNTLIWAGRVVIWLATACAWRRLSWTFIPKRWVSVLTAAAFAFYLESFHLAGEWIVGGVEGKGFAFPFVFLGLAAFVKGKYNRAWILYGIASAFHVLVGGWTVVASFLAWTLAAHLEYDASLQNGNNATKRSFFGGISARIGGFWRSFLRMTPGLAIGGAISLLGLVPALRLDAGATADIIRQAREIYVFERLPHHLVASSLPWTFLLRFGLLVVLFILIVVASNFVRKLTFKSSDKSELLNVSSQTFRYFRLETFVFAAIFIAGIGLTIDFGARILASFGFWDDPRSAAGLLRYYWFRLSDWAVPLGVVFGVARFVESLTRAFLARLRAPEVPRLLGTSLAWTFVGLLIYWAFRMAFDRTARTLAATSALGGLVPLLKPTEAVATLATVDLCAVVLTAFLFATFCGRRRSVGGRILRFAATGGSILVAFLFVVAPGWRLATFVDLRATKVVPRSAPPKESIADGWLDVCRWARENTSEDAIFLVPRGCDSFKWEARRPEAGSWKEIPQDAASIVRWYRKMERFYAVGPKDSSTRWNQPLIVVFLNKGRAKVAEESEKYGYRYAILENPPYVITAIPEAKRRFDELVEAYQVYRNDQYVLLDFEKK